MSVCIRHSFVKTDDELPGGLSDKAKEVAHLLASYCGVTPTKPLCKLVEEACLFYQEIRTLGIEISPIESDTLIECRELTA